MFVLRAVRYSRRLDMKACKTVHLISTLITGENVCMYNRKIIEWSHKTEDRIYKHPILTEDERGIKNKESVPRKNMLR